MVSSSLSLSLLPYSFTDGEEESFWAANGKQETEPSSARQVRFSFMQTEDSYSGLVVLRHFAKIFLVRFSLSSARSLNRWSSS